MATLLYTSSQYNYLLAPTYQEGYTKGYQTQIIQHVKEEIQSLLSELSLASWSTLSRLTITGWSMRWGHVEQERI